MPLRGNWDWGGELRPGPALICFSPVIYSQVTTALSENSLFAFYAAGVLFTLRYLLKGRSVDGVLAAVSAGMLIGIKQTGIPAAGLIFIAMAAKALRAADGRGAAKSPPCFSRV